MRMWDLRIAPDEPKWATSAAHPILVLHPLRTEWPFCRSVPTNTTIQREIQMIDPETHVQIRRYFYAEHWKIGTIASQLGIHKDAVRHAIEADRFHRGQVLRASIIDPYLEFVRQILDQHPRLRAPRIYQMIRDRGYTGILLEPKQLKTSYFCSTSASAFGRRGLGVQIAPDPTKPPADSKRDHRSALHRFGCYFASTVPKLWQNPAQPLHLQLHFASTS